MPSCNSIDISYFRCSSKVSASFSSNTAENSLYLSGRKWVEDNLGDVGIFGKAVGGIGDMIGEGEGVVRGRVEEEEGGLMGVICTA